MPESENMNRCRGRSVSPTKGDITDEIQPGETSFARRAVSLDRTPRNDIEPLLKDPPLFNGPKVNTDETSNEAGNQVNPGHSRSVDVPKSDVGLQTDEGENGIESDNGNMRISKEASGETTIVSLPDNLQTIKKSSEGTESETVESNNVEHHEPAEAKKEKVGSVDPASETETDDSLCPEVSIKVDEEEKAQQHDGQRNDQGSMKETDDATASASLTNSSSFSDNGAVTADKNELDGLDGNKKSKTSRDVQEDTAEDNEEEKETCSSLNPEVSVEVLENDQQKNIEKHDRASILEGDHATELASLTNSSSFSDNGEVTMDKNEFKGSNESKFSLSTSTDAFSKDRDEDAEFSIDKDCTSEEDPSVAETSHKDEKNPVESSEPTLSSSSSLKGVPTGTRENIDCGKLSATDNAGCVTDKAELNTSPVSLPPVRSKSFVDEVEVLKAFRSSPVSLQHHTSFADDVALLRQYRNQDSEEKQVLSCSDSTNSSIVDAMSPETDGSGPGRSATDNGVTESAAPASFTFKSIESDSALSSPVKVPPSQSLPSSPNQKPENLSFVSDFAHDKLDGKNSRRSLLIRRLMKNEEMKHETSGLSKEDHLSLPPRMNYRSSSPHHSSEFPLNTESVIKLTRSLEGSVPPPLNVAQEMKDNDSVLCSLEDSIKLPSMTSSVEDDGFLQRDRTSSLDRTQHGQSPELEETVANSDSDDELSQNSFDGSQAELVVNLARDRASSLDKTHHGKSPETVISSSSDDESVSTSSTLEGQNDTNFVRDRSSSLDRIHHGPSPTPDENLLTPLGKIFRGYHSLSGSSASSCHSLEDITSASETGSSCDGNKENDGRFGNYFKERSQTDPLNLLSLDTHLGDKNDNTMCIQYQDSPNSVSSAQRLLARYLETTGLDPSAAADEAAQFEQEAKLGEKNGLDTEDNPKIHSSFNSPNILLVSPKPNKGTECCRHVQFMVPPEDVEVTGEIAYNGASSVPTIGAQPRKGSGSPESRKEGSSLVSESPFLEEKPSVVHDRMSDDDTTLSSVGIRSAVRTLYGREGYATASGIPCQWVGENETPVDEPEPSAVLCGEESRPKETSSKREGELASIAEDRPRTAKETLTLLFCCFASKEASETKR